MKKFTYRGKNDLDKLEPVVLEYPVYVFWYTKELVLEFYSEWEEATKCRKGRHNIQKKIYSKQELIEWLGNITKEQIDRSLRIKPKNKWVNNW